MTAVKCGKFMKGANVDYVTGGKCKRDRNTGLPTSTCYFKADTDAGVEASIMFYHNVSGVSWSDLVGFVVTLGMLSQAQVGAKLF